MMAVRRRDGKFERVRAVDISGRTPPNDLDLECTVLGALLDVGSKALDSMLPILPNAAPFYGDAHRRIYEVALELHAKGEPVDIKTIAHALLAQDRLNAIGGASYLVGLQGRAASTANIEAYARAIRDTWRMRRGIEAVQVIAAEAYEQPDGDIQAFLDRAVEAISDVADDRIDRRDVVLLYDVLLSEIESFDGRPPSGVRSGLFDVDERTGGMQDGELIIVAGRPGMAKTSYALNVAAHVASAPQNDTELGAIVFSLEMPKEQIAMRMICAEASLDIGRYRKRSLTSGEHDRMIVAANRLGGMPIWVDDTPAITVADLRSKVRAKQHEFNRRAPDGRWLRRLGLVAVDYLQLMTHPGADSREQEISAISRGLKALAKELSVPVVALAQLNRSVETRGGKDKRPQLSDIRDSGAIEQDSDIVQFLYRPEYYIADKDSADARKMQGYAEVIIAKQRNGPTGRVPVTFTDHCTRFDNRSREQWSEVDE
jgi:replicative DNA helicase